MLEIIQQSELLTLILFFLVFMFFGMFSDKAQRMGYVYAAFAMIYIVVGKTTNFNVNIVATAGITISMAGNGILLYQKRQLKNELKKQKGGKL